MTKKQNFNQSIKSIDIDELNLKLSEDLNRLKKVSFSHAISPIANPVSIRNLKRDIARLKTEITSRSIV